eukprot:Rhum_TRINITY_DN12192_c0_g1::Rhum_TRINITY_DN12192_c0_g1_i1::g.49873::m.49873
MLPPAPMPLAAPTERVNTTKAVKRGSLQERLRGYQRELFEEAKEKNCVVFAPTGSGKTWVCSAVLQHVLQRSPKVRYRVPAEETNDKSMLYEDKSPGKNICVFLVNRIPLVEQQGTAIVDAFASVGERVRVLKCSSQHRESRDIDWGEHYAYYDVVVMIDVIFQQLLNDRRIHITEVDLVVVDECHHCTGKSALNLMFQSHFLCNLKKHPEHVPQVLGLTASPGCEETLELTYEKTRALLENMYCTIAMVRNTANALELARTVTPAVQCVEHYRRSPVETGATLVVEEYMRRIEDYLRDYKKATDARKNVASHRQREEAMRGRFASLEKFPVEHTRGDYRGSPEYRMFCTRMASQASREQQIGMQRVFETLGRLCDAVVHMVELGFADTFQELTEDRAAFDRTLKDDGEHPHVEDVRQILGILDEMHAVLLDVATRHNLVAGVVGSISGGGASANGNSTGVASALPSTKMGLLLASLMDAFNIFSLQGSWVLSTYLEPQPGCPVADIQAVAHHFPTDCRVQVTPFERRACNVEVFGGGRRGAEEVMMPTAVLELEGGALSGGEAGVRARGTVAYAPNGVRIASAELCADTLHLHVTLRTAPQDAEAHATLVFKRSQGTAEAKGGSFRAIIFTQTKKGAQRIFERIQQLRCKEESRPAWSRLFPERFVGHGSNGDDKGMSGDQQNRAMRNFRQGVSNVLVATNVAEEGIDIPVCNVVLRYDAQYSVRSLVQSRGRARARNSLFIVIASVEETQRYQRLRSQEEHQEVVVRSLMGVSTRRGQLETPPVTNFWEDKPVHRIAAACAKHGWRRVCIDLVRADGGSPELSIDLRELQLNIVRATPVDCGESWLPVSDKERVRRENEVAAEVCRDLYKLGLVSAVDQIRLAPMDRVWRRTFVGDGALRITRDDEELQPGEVVETRFDAKAWTASVCEQKLTPFLYLQDKIVRKKRGAQMARCQVVEDGGTRFLLPVLSFVYKGEPREVQRGRRCVDENVPLNEQKVQAIEDACLQILKEFFEEKLVRCAPPKQVVSCTGGNPTVLPTASTAYCHVLYTTASSPFASPAAHAAYAAAVPVLPPTTAAAAHNEGMAAVSNPYLVANSSSNGWAH